ncbi:hypothetical protein F183_A44640 [Bryobacterales bacterium F-183]|nr:hypothetical protein F183_A44640 [Bryobacterales bacterium F-183]
MANGAPPGLPAANAGAGKAQKGPPGGAAGNCGWEVYVKTHSQERFWPKAAFDTQLCSINNSNKLGAAQHTQSTTMTDVVSPEAKFTGAGRKRFGVTNKAPDIADEKDWVLVTSASSKTKLPNQNKPITVNDGQCGGSAQHIDLFVRHPLFMYGQLKFKDPEDRELTFPKDFPVAAYSGTGADADTKVASAKLDAEGKFDFEIDRKWDWVTLKFGGAKKHISNGDGSGTKTVLKGWSDRKALEKANAKFFSPPESWTMIESFWKFAEEPKYISGNPAFKEAEGKIYLFDPPTKDWVRRIGEKGAHVALTLDPKWTFLRHEFFDRYYGHGSHNHERVNTPTTTIEGYWGTGGTLDREGSCHWTLTPDDRAKSVHCLPWIRQKDKTGVLQDKPDKDALIQFELPTSTFVASSDANTRKYAVIGASDAKMKANADRLKYYDMPKVWKSKGYWARYLTAPKTYDAKFWEDWDKPGYLKSRSKASPMIFSLDDVVLTDAALVPITLAKDDPYAIFYHRFAQDYDEAANVSKEGVYKPKAAEPYFSDVKREGAKFNYIAEYPNWVRMVAALGGCFDAFDKRTSQDVFGARAGVRWYDPVVSATAAGTAVAGQPADINKKYFVIGPEWGQQHASPVWPFKGASTTPSRTGRFDMVLVRCCDQVAAKEVFINLQYFRLNYNFLAAAPATALAGAAGSIHAGTKGVPYIGPNLKALMSRWNGYDATVPGARAKLLPQKNTLNHTGEVLYFLHPATALQGAHYRMDVFKTAGQDRAFMDSVNGKGEVMDNQSTPDNAHAPNSFTFAHELGHGGSLPDEYGEWWNYCNHSGPGIANNTPADPFVDEGTSHDLMPGGALVANQFAMMVQNVLPRNRYFWHNAEFARKHTKVPLFVGYDALQEYKVPGHPQYPYRTYTYWPVRQKMNRTSGKHGKVDVYLHALGKDKFAENILPNGPFNAMVSVLVKIDLGNIPNTVVVTDVRDLIRNAFLMLNQQFRATGRATVVTDEGNKPYPITKAVVRFSPRFLIGNVDATMAPMWSPAPKSYGQDYASWQGFIKTHFQMTVNDANGVGAPPATAFNGATGGAITVGIDSTNPAWKPKLTADIQALIPAMLGVSATGGVIAAKDLVSLVGSVIDNNAKVI